MHYTLLSPFISVSRVLDELLHASGKVSLHGLLTRRLTTFFRDGKMVWTVEIRSWHHPTVGCSKGVDVGQRLAREPFLSLGARSTSWMTDLVA